MIKLKGLFSQSSILANMLILIGIVIIVFCAILSVIACMSLAKCSVNIVNSPSFLLLLQSVGVFVLPPFLFAYFCTPKVLEFLHLQKEVSLTQVSLVVVFMILVIPGINLLSYFNQQLVLPKALAGVEEWMKTSEAERNNFFEQLLNVHGILPLLFNLFLVALIPAVGEELTFRGTIQSIFRKKTSIRMAIWASAIVFSAIHMQFYGFLPRMLLGAFFGYLLFWSESLWLPIVAHFTNNAFAIIFYYFKNNGYKVPDIDTIGSGSTWWLGLVSLLVAMAGFMLLRNKIQEQSSSLPQS